MILKNAFSLEVNWSSPLTGIDPYLLMRIDPPELCSGFDPSLIFSNAHRH